MDIEELKVKINEKLKEVIRCTGIESQFEVVEGEIVQDELKGDEPNASITYEILFVFGNCKHQHLVNIGYNEFDGFGLEMGEDCDINPITFGSLMTHLYLCLALDNLEEKYCY